MALEKRGELPPPKAEDVHSPRATPQSPCSRSSVGQSVRLLSGRPRVRIAPGAPQHPLNTFRGCCFNASETLGAHRSLPQRAGSSICRKSQGSSRGLRPSRALIVPSGVYGGHGAIFAAENLIFQSKNRFFAVFAPENPKDFSKTGEGGSGGGACFPVHHACQNLF